MMLRMPLDHASQIPPSPVEGGHGHRALIIADPLMSVVVAHVENVALSGAIVLVAGESGVGKDMVAAHLHRSSARAAGPFVALGCDSYAGAFPADGSFGGACFEAADGGTLLLDEVGGLDLRMQARLLRLLEDRELGRIASDVRVVATTNRDLQREVGLGRFRADLYFRLNVVSIKVPPLRQRPLDIPALAMAFARRFALASGRTAATVSPEALAVLGRHAWPGNVRELANVVQRAVLAETGPFVTEGSVDIDPFDGMPDGGVHNVPWRPPATVPAAVVRTEGRTIEDVERDMILEALCSCQANRSRAALVLGISTRTLRNKLHGYERAGVRIPRPVVVAVA